ncbi:MAG: hypothetical protein ACOYXA_11700 [Bacteroidota bacterium]
MRAFIVFILTILFTPTSFSQTVIGSFQQPYDYKMEACEMGDSVLVCLTETGQLASPLSNLYWISENNVRKFGVLRKNKKEELVGVNTSDSMEFYLYSKVDERKSDNLLIRKSMNSVFLDGFSEIPIAGEVIGSFKDSLFNVVVLDKKTSVLKFVSFNGEKKINEKIIRIPFSLAKFRDSDFVFVDPKINLALAHSYARVKFFKNDSELTMVLDEPFQDFVENQTPPYRTVFFKYDLITNRTESKVFFEVNNYYFRSFVIGNFLLRATFVKEGIRITSFDLASQNKVEDMALSQNLSDLMGYQRNSRDFKIVRGKFQELRINLGSDQWSPVIIAENLQNNRAVILVGLYSDAKGAFLVAPGGPAVAAASLLVTAVGTTIMQSQEKPAISNYAYLSTDETGRIVRLESTDTSFRQRMDDYESDNFPVLKFKGYAETRKWKAALYWPEGVKQTEVRLFWKN